MTVDNFLILEKFLRENPFSGDGSAVIQHCNSLPVARVYFFAPPALAKIKSRHSGRNEEGEFH
jgi:hypothetical protein